LTINRGFNCKRTTICTLTSDWRSQTIHWREAAWRAARYLDLSRKTLIYRIERHGIQKPPDRPGSSD
jgi:transcriptional regulator with GAF, ATPase, and Fis domain